MKYLQNAHALVIGIANYDNIEPLPSIVLKDAQDIYELLVNPNMCGYSPTNVQLILDDRATIRGIRNALTNLANCCDLDSTVLLYISSHGGSIEFGPYKGEYLLPVDTIYTSDETVAQTAISSSEFTQALNRLQAHKIVVIFDCCHSGGIGQPKDAVKSVIERGLTEKYYNLLAQGKGRVIFASSRDNEGSYIMPQSNNSLFTHHLLQALTGNIPSEDGLIRIFDLFEYIQPRVTSDHPQQHPVFKAEIEENFPIALYLGGQKESNVKTDKEHHYDAYISYVDEEPDSAWVWDKLIPHLKENNLCIAVSGDAEEPGVDRVVTIERGIMKAKRTVIILSNTYLADHWGIFENVLAQTIGIQEGAYRMLPVQFDEIDEGLLPNRLRMLTRLNIGHPNRSEREFSRLIHALKQPLLSRINK